MSERRLLIFAPHHDDAEFGLGGTIARHRSDGDDCTITLAVAAYGDYQNSEGRQVQGIVREEETRAAAKLLDIDNVLFPGLYVENRSLEVDFGKMVGRLEAIIRQETPTDVFVCMPSFNQDHRVLFDAIMTAYRPKNLDTKYVWGYEYPGNGWGVERPLLGRSYVRLGLEHMQKKRAALLCHKTQFEGRQPGVSPDAAEALAVVRGHECGSPFAECFYLLRELY